MTRPFDILRAHGVVAAAEPGYTPEIGRREVISVLRRSRFSAVHLHGDRLFSADGRNGDVVGVYVHDDAVFVRVLNNDIIKYTLPLKLKELKHVRDAAMTLSRELPDIVEQANTNVAVESRRVMAVVTKVKPTKNGLSLHYGDEFTLDPT